MGQPLLVCRRGKGANNCDRPDESGSSATVAASRPRLAALIAAGDDEHRARYLLRKKGTLFHFVFDKS